MRKFGFCLLLFTLLSGGCADPAWHTKDISHLMPALEFELTDENGRAVTASDYRGKAALVFFGYTHCPDVCPTTLARLASLTQSLDADARKHFQVLFVSVDPERDDPQTLRRYTEAFGPEIIGLTGGKLALDALTRRYRVTYGYGDKDTAGAYLVSHPSAVFAFDRKGGARLLIRDSDSDADVAADLRRLASMP